MANEYDDIMREEVPSPNTEPSYDDIGKVLSVQNSRAVQASMFTAKDRDPVKAAESVNLSREYGLATDIVERKFDEVKKTKILHNDYDRIVTETPGLGKWLETPDKAAVGQNELESLGAIDKGTREIVKKTGIRQAVETGLIGLESSAYALGGLMGMTSLDEAAELMANANKRQQELTQSKPTFAKDFEKTMEKEMGDVNKSLDSMFDAWNETKNKDITAIFKTFKEGALTVGETIDMIATAVSKPRGLAYMTAESAAFALPSLVGAAGGAAVGTAVTPGVGTAIGLASGTFAGSVLTETGAWMNQALSDRGYDITNAESIRQAFSDRSLLKEMRDEAVRKGVTTASVDALFSAFAGKIATGPAKSVAGRAARVVGDTGTQMLGEALSEGAGQYAATGKVDVGNSILEGIASLGQSAAETAIGTTATAGKEIAGKAQDAYRKRYSPDPIRATQEVAIDTTNALEAMQAAENLQQIQVAVEAAENTRKVPGYIKDLVDASTESDVVQSVYFQSDDFDDYFNRKGLSPSKAAYDISEEVGKSYDESKENGTPIEVPLGEYVEKVAPNKETFDDMLEIVRTKPDGMTLAEAQEHVKNLQQTMNDLADEAIAAEQANQKQVNEADQKSLNDYSSRLQDQLMVSGMSQNDAKAAAQLETQRLQNRASIRGQSIADVIAERPLTVTLQDGMGTEGALNQEGSDQSPIGFYSQLGKEIAKMDFNQIPAKDLANRIKNVQGLKKEELEAIGLNEWLEAQDGKVTKEEVINFINSNGVQVEQIVLGGEGGEDSTLEGMNWVDEGRSDLEDSGLFSDNIQNEIDNYDEEYLKETWPDEYAAAVERVNKEEPNSKGYQRERAIRYYMNDTLEPVAEEYVRSEDYYGAEFTHQEQSSGFTLSGNDERGWYNSDYGEHFEGNLEEAKIQLAAMMIEKGDLEGDLSQLVNVADIKFRDASGKIPSYATMKKKIKGYVDKNRASLERRVIEDNPWIMEQEDKSEVDSDIKSYVDDLAREEISKQYADPSNPRNTVEVTLTHDAFDPNPKIVGNNKKGYKLKVDDKEFNLISKDLESAKQESLKVLVVEGFANDKPKVQTDSKDVNTPQGPSKFGRYTVEGGENYREVLLTLPKAGPEKFVYSNHFSNPNVIAHVRLTDRVDDKGRKTLFIEELQSDWHQQGRERGYATEDVKTKNKEVESQIESIDKKIDSVYASFREEMKSATKKHLSVGDVKDLATSGEQENFGITDKAVSLAQEHETLTNQKRELKEQLVDAVPDAPFKNTEAWASLAIKRIIRMAVEQGYEAVAWTPAEVHVERWGTDNISWIKKGDKFLVGSAEQRGGNADGMDIEEVARARGELLERNGAEVSTKEELREVIAETLGRERNDRSLESLTDNVWNQMQAKETGVKQPRKEGMEFFYDNVIPKKVAQPLLKKLDKDAKIEVVEFDTNSVKTEDGGSYRIPGEEGLKALSIPITDQMKEKVSTEGFSLFQKGTQGPRGQFRIAESQAFIDLFKGRKNPSTIIHELGHLWRFQVEDDLKYVQGLESNNEAQDQFKKDVDSMLKFLEASDIANLTVEQEEKFARAIELYMMEGKAPSADLQSAFSRIKVWMLSVYRSVKNFFKQNNVELNNDIREVFDRLFVAETETTESQLEMNYEAPFEDARAAGMSEAQARRYQEAREKSRTAAEQILANKLIADYKQQEQKVYKERRATVKAEVTEVVNNTRVYKALDNIRAGELEGGGSMKLDRQALVEMYDENFVKNRLKNLRIYTKEGGLNPVVAASLLGYESADQMIIEMVNAPPKEAAINRITDERMREEYPDLMYQPDLEAEAMKAVHNEKQAQVYRLELEFFLSQEKSSTKDVVRAITRKIPSTKSVKAEAQRVIGEKKVNDVKPYIYRRAEANYNREAGIAFAKGDFDAAFEAKRKALLNYEMFNVAVEAIEQFRKDKDFFKKFRQSDEKLSKTRDINFIEAGRAILSSYGLYRNDGSKPSDFLNDMKKYDPQAYETVAAIMDSIANKGNDNWKTLKYNSYKDMSDGVKALWDLSKEARNIEINGKKMDIEEAATDLLSGFSEHQKKIDKKEFIEKYGPVEKLKLKYLGFKASLTRVEHWTNMMDLGDKVNGPFRKYIYQPIVDGTTQYRLNKFTNLKKLLSILEPLQNDMSNDSMFLAPELTSAVGSMDGVARPYKFSFNELLGMILHTGNDSNKRKLLLGRGWGTLDQDGNLVTTNFDKFMNRMYAEGVIKKEHMDAIQNIWDLMEEMKPAAQKAHKQMYGYYFNEITANEVVTPFGTYRGGYVPAKADPMIVLDAERRALVEQIEKEQGNFAFPATTGRGSTFSRVEQYNAPLIMDLRMITNHVDWAMRFSHIEPKIKQVSRLLNNKNVFAELNTFDPAALKEMLIPFTKRAASQKLTEINDIADKTVGRVLNYVRTNTGAGLMFFNIGNLMEQIFSSVPQAMTQVKGKFVMNAMMDYVTNSKDMTEFVNDKSDFMKTRGKRSIHLVNEQLDNLLSDPSKFEELQKFAKNNAYILQGGAQNMMDIFIWKAAYEQAIGDKGATESQAVTYADSIIRETQSTFNPEDAAAIEAGGPMRRAFMMFYSYFNTMGNLVATQIAAIQKDLGFKKGAGRMFWIYMMGVAMPAFISQLVKKTLAGRFDEDDDDEYLDDLFGAFFMGQFQSVTATVPWAGALINNALNQFNDKPYDDRLSLSPVVSVIESTARTPMHAYNLLSEEGRVNERQATRDFLTLISVTTGLPAMPLARPISYLRDVSEGRANPSGPIDFTRGLISGKPGE